MYNLSNICKAANELTKKGLSKSESFKKAWELAKNIISKVSGVSFGKRPVALARLTHYNPEQISVNLVREESNPFDSNAIAVMATVEGKGGREGGKASAERSAAVREASRQTGTTGGEITEESGAVQVIIRRLGVDALTAFFVSSF